VTGSAGRRRAGFARWPSGRRQNRQT
jgi:hypothetical protein